MHYRVKPLRIKVGNEPDGVTWSLMWSVETKNGHQASVCRTRKEARDLARRLKAEAASITVEDVAE